MQIKIRVMTVNIINMLHDYLINQVMTIYIVKDEFHFEVNMILQIIFESYYLFKIGSIKLNTTFGAINQPMHRFFYVMYRNVLQHLGYGCLNGWNIIIKCSFHLCFQFWK